MPQIKEPYGLVYNTDGTLCTTYRDDNVPFRGVRSFAVETATTNLVTNSPQQPPCIKQQDASFTRTIVTSGSLAGWVKINITNTGTNPSMIHFGLYSHPANETRTYAIDAILPDDMFLEVTGRYGLGSIPKISNTRYAKTVTPDSGGNYGIYIYSTLPVNTTGSWDVYVRNYQIEQKPFATSFVDGSRPSGNLTINNIPTKSVTMTNGTYNIFTNHVFAFWFKVPTVRDEELNTTDQYASFRMFLIFGNSNSIYHWSNGSFQLYINRSNGNLYFRSGPFAYDGDVIIKLANKGGYENAWHFVVISRFYDEINQNFETKLWFDGVYKGMALATNLVGKVGSTDYITLSNGYKRSNFISNLFIGDYKDKDGNVIWTDEFIQEVYEAKIPFPVQSQLAIY